jgi:hypothetical protein
VCVCVCVCVCDACMCTPTYREAFVFYMPQIRHVDVLCFVCV